MKANRPTLKTSHLFLFGILAVLLSFLPFLLLGTDAIVPYHDQLDGEIIAYIYRAKYLFGGEIIPEFMNGASPNTLTPPAPLAVLLFKVFTPFTAYLLLQFGGQLTAFVGMFLLAVKLSGNKWNALIVALLYAFLPFLPVYGLSQYGIPLLLVCLWELYRGTHKGFSYAYIALYTAMSSLVLCGFVWLAGWAILLVTLCFRKALKSCLPMLWGFLLMLGIYLSENLSLLLQILGLKDSYVSHKIEYAATGSSFLSSFTEQLLHGSDHYLDRHEGILFLSILLLAGILVAYKNCDKETLQRSKWLLLDLALICAFCLIAAFWQSSSSFALRSNLGTLGAFQIGRVMWLAPTLWYAALSICLSILWKHRHTWLRYFGYGLSLLVLGITGILCFKHSLVKPCIQELLIEDYETISWSDYYASDVMVQVETFLLEQEGLTKEEYKVASLGIDPASALYHGFYCVDGYSNNYDLDYKKAFRAVIAPELERNAWLKDYYDNWGNRCYLFSSEIPGYFNIEKGSFWYNDLQLDTDALKALGCDYILSAAYIVNAADIHLQLLSQEPCQTPESYYAIYIYKIVP